MSKPAINHDTEIWTDRYLFMNTVPVEISYHRHHAIHIRFPTMRIGAYRNYPTAPGVLYFDGEPQNADEQFLILTCFEMVDRSQKNRYNEIIDKSKLYFKYAAKALHSMIKTGELKPVEDKIF